MTYCTRTRHGIVDEPTPGGRAFRMCRTHARRRRAPHPHASPAEHYELLRMLDDHASPRPLRGRARTRRIGWLLQRMVGRSHLRPLEPLAVPPTKVVGSCTPTVAPEPVEAPEGSEGTEVTEVTEVTEGTVELDLTQALEPIEHSDHHDSDATALAPGEARDGRTASAALASLAAHRAVGRKARP
jgi:hypothetical protein